MTQPTDSPTPEPIQVPALTIDRQQVVLLTEALAEAQARNEYLLKRCDRLALMLASLQAHVSEGAEASSSTDEAGTPPRSLHV